MVVGGYAQKAHISMFRVIEIKCLPAFIGRVVVADLNAFDNPS